MRIKRRTTLGLCVALSLMIAVVTTMSKRHPSGSELAIRGNLMWYNRPSAIAHDGNVYTSWMTNKREIVVASHSSAGQLLASVVDHHRWLDDHGSPVLFQSTEQRLLHVIYCLHNSPVYMRSSGSNYNITDWSDRIEIDSGECTYPQIVTSESRTQVLYRKSVGHSKSLVARNWNATDGRFENAITLIEPNAEEWVYAIGEGGANGDTVDLVFGIAVNEVVQNIYHLRSPDGGATWGLPGAGQASALEPPISPTSLTPIFATLSGRETRVLDSKHSADGGLVILAADYSGQFVDLMLGSWSPIDQEWRFETIVSQGISYYPSGGCILSTNPICLMLSVKSDNNGRHGLSTFKETAVGWTASLFRQDDNFDLVRPMAVRGVASQIGAMWVGVRSYEDFMSFDTFIGGTMFEGDGSALGGVSLDSAKALPNTQSPSGADDTSKAVR